MVQFHDHLSIQTYIPQVFFKGGGRGWWDGALIKGSTKKYETVERKDPYRSLSSKYIVYQKLFEPALHQQYNWPNSV